MSTCIALTLLLCLAAFSALALGTARQQEDLFGHELAPVATRAWRACGWLLLAAALAVLVTGAGWALGLVIFSGTTSAAAGAVYLLLVAHGRRQAR